MSRFRRHPETHLVSRIGWLRAAVLGANDGVISVASLVLGVAASAARPVDVLVAGAAGLVAGAMSMATGEYVSVSSQSDTERAALSLERKELGENPGAEHAELAQIYIARGLDAETAAKVASQLMAKDALGAHAHDELGISNASSARPIQAALTSAAAFTAGAAMPLAVAALAPANWRIPVVSIGSLIFLAVLGVIGARIGDANPWRAAARVSFWGALAMALTAAIGHIVGTVI
jgi:VIT1/CCC1 family predicted Fe2+/Mn2+ transporter